MSRPASAAPSARTRLRRLPEKAAYDRAAINAILDAMPVAHVGYVIDGAPVVIPTLQWREGDRIYWHGSSASRSLRAGAGMQVCVTVSLTDAMVLARSAFEHSVNHRSVMVFGQAEAVTDPAAKRAHLKTMVDSLFPGRWETLRPMTEQEVKATGLLSLPLTEASAKIAAAPPGGTDPDEDRGWPVWAGLIPVALATSTPVAAPDLAPGIALPEGVARWRFGEGPR
ncbi:pyridoxamine 5'-phosphate oxidase family protein [Pseudogemmobacter blasticus]|uniref:Flavin-nucleotide-binding protein n=1 Tax=Fuscovulum blasticum DSM 2131 TaxID=1188250 RepID=A0A2T4J498_FUSBL|nr:pyridoxamine 5'-phosphate oxidase family protein [Fuscovulum blasticum]AWD21273.1 flavin-nucleotide-binding protein [Fuscovulum blasticum]PTE12695.1 flavin-nucleotide-binding protein [Fuscovulum blasticum DSM 2131]